MTQRDQAHLARLACERRAALENYRNRGAVHRLNAIAASAFFLGTFLTVIWIVSCFRGVTGDKYTHFLYLMAGLARSLRPLVIGLAVAIPATMLSAHIRARAEEFAVEMDNATVQLENYLLRY